MKSSLLYFLRLIVFWLLIFEVSKFYFLWVNGVGFLESISVFPRLLWNGLPLDLSIVGYLSVIPLLILSLQKIFPSLVAQLLHVYWWIVVVLSIVILAVDPYFFYYWGQKTNLAFTQFIGKENAGFASIEFSTYLIVVVALILFILSFITFGKYLRKANGLSNSLLNLLLIGVCILMIRGGLGKVPINISSAYFSQNHIYNNAAVNPIWSFLATELEKDKHKPLVFFENEEKMDEILASLPASSVLEIDSLISSAEKPNVLLIVLESFSAKVVGALNDDKYGCTPHLDKVLSEGISYSNAYASSFRSDKGLLAITTGFPSGARQTLTNFPGKLANHPNIFQQLPDGYHSSFYYGGDIDFANIKVLFQQADEQFTQDDIDSDVKNAWGVHDEVMFDKFTNDFLREQRPQFKMLFSLSSHEPFDVPDYNHFEDAYINCIAYTDSCLGVMMKTLNQSEKWENTLIIITADHGTIRPEKSALWQTQNFKIPLVLTGGLVKQDTVISNVVSQADIPATLNTIFGNDDNIYIRPSLFTPANSAFFSYHDGLVYVSDSCTQHFDLGSTSYINNPCVKPLEKAYFQKMNQLFFSN